MRSEFYQPVNIVPVPSETLQSVDGEDHLVDCLFEDPDIKELSLGVVSGRPKKALEEEAPFASLVRISPYHGRSFELRFNGQRTFPFEDEFGNVYTNFNLKGNDFRDFGVIRTQTSPSGYSANGLLDSDALLRIVRSSRALRSLGIDTEYINRVMFPTEFPSQKQTLTSGELKRKLLAEGITDKDPAQAGIIKSLIDIMNENDEDPEDTKVFKFLKNTEFVVILRSVGVSERLKDLSFVKNRRELTKVMRAAFDYVNFTEKLQAEKDTSYSPQHFNAESDEDIKRYMLDYLPKKLAKTFSTMHDNGIVHMFPHTGNLSLAGGLYDLDSVKGEALNLGDNPITCTDMDDDMAYLLNDIAEVFNYPAVRDVLAGGTVEIDEEANKIVAEKLHQQFTVNFLNNYLPNVSRKVNALEVTGKLMEVWQHTNEDKASDLLDNLFGTGRFPLLDYGFEGETDQLYKVYNGLYEAQCSGVLRELKVRCGPLSKDDIWTAIMYFTSDKLNLKIFSGQCVSEDLNNRFEFGVLEAEFGEKAVGVYKNYLVKREAKRLLERLVKERRVDMDFYKVVAQMADEYSDDVPSIGLSSSFKIRLAD